MATPSLIGDKFIFHRGDLQKLLEELTASGYQVVGPTVRDGAIVYDTVNSLSDLPEGWTDKQDGGKYRLEKRQDNALFGYNVGPHSWKKFLFPPRQKLWTAKRNAHGFEIHPENEKAPRYAFLGVRSCELHAIAIQDKVFLQDAYKDPLYQERRENLLIIAVNCGQAGNTCFCVSMNTGPEVSTGYDLVLTEVINSKQHYFVVEVGTKKGMTFFEKLPKVPAKPQEQTAAQKSVNRAAEQMGRTLNTEGIHSLLQDNLDHPRWDDVAKRCLSCANCTMACPTCFCSTVDDVTDLSGNHADRWRNWDSCFNLDFTYMHGGHARHSFKSRYRQWMTHKLSTWHDQFDTSGCVGCGRCITWCPEGIDITEEAAAIRNTPTSGEKK